MGCTNGGDLANNTMLIQRYASILCHNFHQYDQVNKASTNLKNLINLSYVESIGLIVNNKDLQNLILPPSLRIFLLSNQRSATFVRHH